MTPRSRVPLLLGVALAVALAPARALGQTPGADPALLSRIDSVFAAFDHTRTPGCAVGVDRGGASQLRRAYGMADLEHGVPNTPGTVFENGSVSKQFTAAAVILLELDGRLSLEDDVRSWVPELPDYGSVLTLRHLMTHTSGLRDWGSVAGISGWGRGERSHDHADVLDILGRQSALNFPPGHEYSYSNSGYNLLAMVVERASGLSFADFSRERIFEPLGMHHTQWRDDYRRIVPGRSTAYQARGPGAFAIDRPIEYVHGNGGLLTTVDDLLVWNRSLDDASLAGPRFVEMMLEQGVLNDGRRIAYAGGLFVGTTLGLPSVTHTGATAGYRAFLGRFPEQDLSVALLCNVGSANPGALGAQVARVFLGDEVGPDPAPPPARSLPPGLLEARAGLYREVQTGWDVRLAVDEDGVLRWGRTALTPLSGTDLAVGTSGTRIHFPAGAAPETRAGFEVSEPLPEGRGRVVVDRYEPEEPVDPSAAELGEYVGSYRSEDAETTLIVSVEEDRLMVSRRPDDRFTLRPVYRDAFRGGPGFIRFVRDETGEVTELSLGQSRVYDLRFKLQAPGSTPPR